MSDLYLRKVSLEIFPESGAGKTITELRIKFNCEKTNESNPNNGNIEIYNLSEQTRSLLEAAKTRVALQIGYYGIPNEDGSFNSSKSNAETIFVGDVVKTLHKVEGSDLITTIEVADGGNRFRNARLDKGYPAGIRTDTVFDDIEAAMGLAKGARSGIPTTKYANGLTLSGLARDHLNNLTKKNNLEWSIQDETLQIIPQGQGTDETIVLLTSDSGLIGSPNKTAKGVEFSSLVQPTLKPGRRVQIQSRTLNGVFKIRKVTHDGDSHSGDFLSKCEATT